MIFENSECDFCGKIKDYVCSTSFGIYCKDCIINCLLPEINEGLEKIKIAEEGWEI